MEDLNYALSTIKTDVSYESDLYEEFFGKSAAETDRQFTREELAYIANSDEILVGVQANRFPLVQSMENGEIQGIYIDVMEQIAEFSGLNFRYEASPRGMSADNYMKSTDAKLFAGIAESPLVFYSPELVLSSPFLISSVSMVGRQNESFDPEASMTFAVSKGYINGEKVLREMYPQAEIKIYETGDDCLYAIKRARPIF